MRPMLTEYPLDIAGYKLDNQYLLSDKLLVAPVIEQGQLKRNVYFPSTDGDNAGDLWYDIDDYHKIDKVGVQSIEAILTKIPVYQRGGTIIPMKETIRKSSIEMINDPISLMIAVSKDHKATGTLFLDDEKSYNYRGKQYIYLKFEFSHDTLTSSYIDDKAYYNANNTLGRILIAGLDVVPTLAKIKFASGTEKDLEIVTKDNFFEIISKDVILRDEWTITLSGAKQNILCASLFLVTLMAHFAKSLFH